MKKSTRVTALAQALAAAATLALAGCGGGGSSDSSAAETSATTGGEAAAQGLGDLQIGRRNDLRAVSDITIEIQMTTNESFISVCPHPGGTIDAGDFDYGDCMLRSRLDATPQLFDIDLPNHVDRLVAIVWYFDDAKTPLVRTWRRKGDADPAIWRIYENG